MANKFHDKKVQVFAHRGYIGINANVSVDEYKDFILPEGLLNDPTAFGQLGFVMNPEFVEISQEAVDIIKAMGKEGGSFSKLMVDKNSFSWAGGGTVCLNPETKLGRTCTAEHLKATDGVKVPQDFKDYVDGLLS